MNDFDEPKTSIDKKIFGYTTTYDFGELKPRIMKLSQKQKKDFIKFFETRGIGAFTAFEAARGEKYALEMVRKKLLQYKNAEE